MFPKSFFLCISLLILASLACGVNVDLPDVQVKVGPTQTENIHIADPGGDAARFTISFGAGELRVQPGAAAGSLVTGTAIYNVADLKPIITSEDGKITLKSGELQIQGIPNFTKDFRNEWDLQLGSMPMDLVINAGAYSGEIELGGLALRSLEIGDGAADVEVHFSQANPLTMSEFEYNTGASNVELYGLANANFARMNFNSGAGDYTLDFSGDLMQAADVEITSGGSQITLIVPQGMNAVVNVDGALLDISTSGDWSKEGDVYRTTGSGPTLSISVEMAAGSLKLEQ